MKWLREAAPYINSFRRRTFVVLLSGEAVASDNFDNILSDLCLLASLDVRLVIVFGATPQIDAGLAAAGLESFRRPGGERITSAAAIAAVQEVVGRLRTDFEARLSMGIADSPRHGAALRVVSGNYVKARPLGIIDGIDHEHTGRTRRIETAAIREQLELGNLVLIPPLGYSVTGETFNLRALPLAQRTAVDLRADKLVLFTATAGLVIDGRTVSEVLPDQIDDYADHPQVDAQLFDCLQTAALACREGVERCAIVSFADDGAILEELFTREGSGTQIRLRSYEQLRPATPSDIPGILTLIRPLEEAGTLARRSRELIESEIDHFAVIARDGLVVTCGALYPFGDSGEIACMATHPDYRNADRGERLLDHLEALARRRDLDSTFVLTTQSAHWFQERGYQADTVDSLPVDRRPIYNLQRNSRVFRKALSAAPLS